MATKQQLENGYIDYVLTHGKRPPSVYLFAKKLKTTETEFYNHYGSFDGLEESVWTGFVAQTIESSKLQEVWAQYSAREKGLSFFYTLIEVLKPRRSFVLFSLNSLPKRIGTPLVFKTSREMFDNFAAEIINEGLESGELADRKFLSNRYKDALWAQFVFILNFWKKMEAQVLKKTDEAIEKGINVTFDLFQRSPIDNLLDYGKFLFRNGGMRSGARA